MFRETSAAGRAVRIWLYAVAVLVFAMVMVGGATRLTESGLSITEWKPVTGALPPLSEPAWQVEFEKYKLIPQYTQMNAGMTLAEFKTIFWWEWTHRFLGRFVGLAYLLPFLFFLWRGCVASAWRGPLWGIFALGALQGAVGWWMVASGLVDRINVAPLRLAFHLTLAAVIYAALIFTADRIAGSSRPRPAASALAREGWGGGWSRTRRSLSARSTALALLVLVLAQIYLGALVAGLRAGYLYNTWPLIDGALIPDAARLWFETPWWKNLFDNALTVQFLHRCVAYLVLALAAWHAFDLRRTAPDSAMAGRAAILLAAVLVQATLGILTLVNVVPLGLALSHQAMAMMVLALATLHVARLPQVRAEPARLAVGTP
jgi:heme a synthase